MSITSALHKTLFALAFLVSIVHFAMVTQTTWQGLAVIDNLQTWLKLHSDVFPPQFNIRSNSLLTLSDGDYRFTQQALDHAKSVHVAWCSYWAAVSGLTLLYYLVHLIVRIVRPSASFIYTGVDIGANVFLLVATIIAIAAGRIVDSGQSPFVALVFGIIQLVLFGIILVFEGIYVFLKRQRGGVLRASFDTLANEQVEEHGLEGGKADNSSV